MHGIDCAFAGERNDRLTRVCNRLLTGTGRQAYAVQMNDFLGRARFILPQQTATNIMIIFNYAAQ